MDKIIDVDEVQRELDRAAHDAKHGPVGVRAVRFMHRNAKDGKFTLGKTARKMRRSHGRRTGKKRA